MSVIFIVAPAVAIGWPVLCSSIAGAAAVLGFTLESAACAAEGAAHSQKDMEQQTGIDLALDGSDIVSESMKRESEFAITNGEVTATFRRAADGHCTVHVSGQNKTDAELQSIGQEILGRVTQQYAYNKVVTELKKQGFAIADEEMTTDQAVRLRVRKYV